MKFLRNGDWVRSIEFKWNFERIDCLKVNSNEIFNCGRLFLALKNWISCKQFRDDPAPIRVTSAKAGDKTRRPKTPLNQTQRPNITSETKTTTHQTHNRKHNVLSTSKDTHIDYLTSNLTKHTTNTKTPTPRSTLRDIPGFSNETPPNLVTDISRSISATRSRPDANRSTSVNKSRPVPRRQSCSPSVTRGRDVTSSIKIENDQMSRNKISGTHVLGSRMVERMMNARSTATKVCSEDRRESTARLKSRTSLDYTSRNMVWFFYFHF